MTSPPSSISAVGGLPTAVLSDCLGRLQAMDGGIRRLSGQGLAGPAWTVTTVAGDSRTVHRAVASAPAGSVLVIDAGGHDRRAVWGDVLTHAAQKAGILGVVADGVVRDIAHIRAGGFPLYARGTCPAGPHKGGSGPVGAVISCGSVVVAPGDIVVGDADGIVVVPHDSIQNVLTCANRRLSTEEAWRGRIADGESTVSILGLE